MSEYVKECIFCKKKIQISDKTGKWFPYNRDGSQHDCKKSSKNGNGDGNNNDISLEVLLKKLESVGITINLERLRNTINGDKK
jgi:hypothetical protein